MSVNRYLKKVVNKVEGSQIRNIDFIYVINLDKHPEKFERCKGQFAPYQIIPHRFPAISGRDLPLEAFDDIGSKNGYFASPMARRCLSTSESHHCYVGPHMTKGGIGCALSHLSILRDAYESGYQTIWVLEDDLLIKNDPRSLTKSIDELDRLTDKKWDILYTDDDQRLPSHLSLFQTACLRPEMPPVDRSDLRHVKLSESFVKIWGRLGAHSMILRRSGIEKILIHIFCYDLFHPYDRELSCIPRLKQFNLIGGPVCCGNYHSPSDTLFD